MKSLILITFLLIPFIAVSQTNKPIDSFLGVKFGSSKSEVVSALKTRGAALSESDSDASRSVFGNVTLGHQEAKYLAVSFVDEKASDATFMFKSDVENKTLELYNDLVKSITEVYGAGKTTKRISAIYSGTDISGNESLLIKSGDADYNTTWLDKNGNAIIIYIDTKLSIWLGYTDRMLSDIAAKKAKAKSKADF
jgi:hypothetical protein